MQHSRIARWAVPILAALCLQSAASAGESPGRVVDRWFEAYRDASLERMLASYTNEAVFEDVNQRHHFEGTEQISQLLAGLVALHHTMDVREKRRVVDGDIVVVEYDYVGTLNGAALGQSVGKEGCPDLEYVLPATSWYRIEGKKIAHQRDFIDWATFLELREKLLAAGS
ncbi:MAG: nuclear transport factor 2 family protein [bacterium]|nr:nuclear transport factor 2 family protein [bacterium]